MIVTRLEFMPDELRSLYDAGAISGFVGVSEQSFNTGGITSTGFNIEGALTIDCNLQLEIEALQRHFQRLKARMNKALDYLR